MLGSGLALLVVALPLAFSWRIAATFFGAKVLPLYGGAALVALAGVVAGVYSAPTTRGPGSCSGLHVWSRGP